MKEFFNGLKNNKEKVEFLLNKYPALRDNDSKLIANFWNCQIGNSLKDMKAPEFLKMFADGNLVNPETIRRVRQKLQEQNPYLRGEKYNKRLQQSEYVRKSINDL